MTRPDAPPEPQPRPDYADAWQAATGTVWTHTDGVSALIHMKSLARNKQPRWRLVDPGSLDYWEPPAPIVDIRWHRPRKAPAGPWHRWDMRAAYLNAIGQVELPYRQLKATGPLPAPAGPGYYRIAITAGQASQLYLPRPDRQGCIWLTGPEMDSTLRRANHEIIDSYTSDDNGRILRAWAEQWGQLIARHPQLAPAFKRGYAQAAGLMGAKSLGIYRPDWRHQFVGHVRASMRRRILWVADEHGHMPARIDVDSVWYSEPEIGSGPAAMRVDWTLGTGPNNGQMRYEGMETP